MLIIALAVIGIANTSYLSYHSIKKTPVKCVFFPNEWCRKVQQSKFSRTFGFPNSFAGLGMYVALLVLTLLYSAGTLNVFWPILAIVWAGFIFSMYFTFIQAFVLKAFCTWCVLSAAEFTLLFLIVNFWVA